MPRTPTRPRAGHPRLSSCTRRHVGYDALAGAGLTPALSSPTPGLRPLSLRRSPMHSPDRRAFLRRSARAVAGAAGVTLLSRPAAKAAPSERVTLCVVGIRGRARRLADTSARLPDAQITHVCDVNSTLLAPASKLLGDVQKTEPKLVQDL